MESQRQKKVSRLIQKDLSAIFLQESKSHYTGILISITHVFVSKDLSLAKVYLSLFPENKKADFFEDIKLKTKYFKHKLAVKLKDQMRKTPDLVFYIDNSLDHYESINKILKDI
tara:strand:- start:55 stop:396 length:342 start_codon:yes stop_codon:yes gene_type:complete